MQVKTLQGCVLHVSRFMAKFAAEKRVAAPQSVAFQVAADVASYKDFLPLLQRSTVRGGKQRDGELETFLAELAVVYEKLGFKESFVSKVTVDHKSQTVAAKSTDGPFRAVETCWKITADGAGSRVVISIDYHLKNPLLQMALGGLMPMATEKIMQAFEKRAMCLSAVV